MWNTVNEYGVVNGGYIWGKISSFRTDRLSYPLRGKKLSLRRRLRRFIANEAVDVEQWYATRADGLIQSAGWGQTQLRARYHQDQQGAPVIMYRGSLPSSHLGFKLGLGRASQRTLHRETTSDLTQTTRRPHCG